MSDSHELIEKKLSEYPTDVQQLAREALRLAKTMSDNSVTEQLKNVIRSVVKETKVSE